MHRAVWVRCLVVGSILPRERYHKRATGVDGIDGNAYQVSLRGVAHIRSAKCRICIGYLIKILVVKVVLEYNWARIYLVRICGARTEHSPGKERAGSSNPWVDGA